VFEEGFASVEGLRLRYRVGGEGPLAVFGHGLLGSIEQLDAGPAWGAILERVRVLLFDARGHGQSDGPEDPSAYTWEALGLDMVRLAARFGGEPAILGGASMGAGAALWAAVERPAAVRALVLAVPPPLGPPSMRGEDEHRAIQALELLAAAIAAYGLEQTAELAKNMPGFAATPEEAEERAAWLRAQNPRTVVHAIRGLLQAPIHDPEAYRTIRVPTLVLAHEGDGLHPVRAARLLASTIPDCTVRVAPDPGYWQRHPEAFVAEVRAFLNRVG
jgi:pimeloyl-ACP methyl ester carboxylesterase